MPNTLYTPVSTWQISRALLADTLDALWIDGCGRRESIVFWVGSRFEGVAQIVTAVTVDGPGVIKLADYLYVSDQVIARMADLILDPPRAVLLGQVHTHKNGLRHSPTDDTHIFDSPGYLSVVVNRYAEGAIADPGTWGIHVGTGQGFEVLSTTKSRQKIHCIGEGESDVRHIYA